VASVATVKADAVRLLERLNVPHKLPGYAFQIPLVVLLQ
jgi:hypothetical protein